MKRIKLFNKKSEIHAIGLMSGTSADGLDVAHVLINPDSDVDFTLLDFFAYEYSPEIKQKILAVSAPDGGKIEDVCELNFFLGHLFSKIVLNYLQQTNVQPNEIDFIGSHGQTVCHLPEKIFEHGIKFGSTLQIADPSIIANRTGIITVGDFRIADMALGGEGAPLVPIFDYLYFRHSIKNRLVLNIGGIANITFLPAGSLYDHLLAFDTGPGNVIIDSLAHKYFGVPFDKDGLFAQKGEINFELLQLLMQDEYFSRKPPKSTGREKFAGQFLHNMLSFADEKKIKPENLLATVTELTAKTIFKACNDFNASSSPINEIIVSGGGAKNPFLMKSLSQYFSESDIVNSDKLGVPGDAKEAICFAVMAYRTLLGKSSNLPSVTGASHRAILGKICLSGKQ